MPAAGVPNGGAPAAGAVGVAPGVVPGVVVAAGIGCVVQVKLGVPALPPVPLADCEQNTTCRFVTSINHVDAFAVPPEEELLPVFPNRGINNSCVVGVVGVAGVVGVICAYANELDNASAGMMRERIFIDCS